jgi:hypothetical protein
MNKKIFAKGFESLCVAFSHKIEPEQAKIYYQILDGMSDDKFIESVKLCLLGKWFPKPIEILQATYKEIPEHVIKDDILRAIGYPGMYGRPKFEYKLSEMIASDIGWVTLCQMDMENFNDKIHWGYMSASKEYKQAMTTDRHIAIESGGLNSLINGGSRGRGRLQQLGKIID